MKWIKKFLPSYRLSREKLTCRMSAPDAPCHYIPIPIHDLKLTPLIRAKVNRYRESPVIVQPPNMQKRLGVVVPYRHREAHLAVFPGALSAFLTAESIQHTILIVEQGDDAQPFNCGQLKNVGASLLMSSCDYICFHDIDMLPITASYGMTHHPTLLAHSISQFDIHKNHSTYFSGALLFTPEHFSAVNGFSNEYWHWGCEDDDLFMRCLLAGLTPIADTRGRFESLPHQPSIIQTPDGQYQQDPAKKIALQKLYEKNKARYKAMRRGLIDFRQEGLNTLRFTVKNKQQYISYEKVTVEIG